ncbi:delta 6-fatty acetylenase [Thecamonas trahens ATCC 50062]|uniref:Delta 6-fatty acetylenase n=1 Tax=Thecamonas trahens ATCC 50062 TaxID=461836 RepID=A0A0L0DC72_THETB|nr:delta 6-fatty acetylenase [Thecamonas trahens ATCC 50062]KNC49681.1 delta 6-fatty acetylenase [Thecamonas trahens ATCC 50062]|eukprot:XP_013757477.1 delta 6-fatty acetylenase [Thecamonas trahens ATCC 50062]
MVAEAGQTYSASEVAQHGTMDDFWIIIHDEVYDITSFVSKHPGGPVIEPYAGLDATDVFDAMHPEWVTKWLPPYRIGSLNKPNATPFQAEYRALRADFVKEGLYESRKTFYATMASISLALVATGIVCIGVMPNTWCWNAIGCVALAFFWQQNGWISHDYLHYSVFDSRLSNWVLPWILGAVGSGYTYIWWSRKHNTHHAVPNIVDGDPDIDTMPILAWSERNIQRVGPLGAFARFWVRNQAWFFMPLLAFARISWTIQSGMTVFEDAEQYAVWRRSNKSLTAWRYIESFGQILYWTWTFALFFVSQDSLVHAVGLWLAAQLLSGLLLASPFVVNHSGMEVFHEGSARYVNFFELQARTGRNIDPSLFMNWFTGGLNFQIEHHLYPRMPRHSYPLIKPRVEALCAKHNIPYHSVGFFTGLAEVVQHLAKTGASVDRVVADDKSL